MRPSANSRTRAPGIFRDRATSLTKRPNMSSITPWKTARSSGVSARNGEPASFIAPDLMASGATPIFSISPCALMVSITTPMLPVIELGDLAIQRVGSGHRAAGAVDAQDQSLDLVVLLRLAKLLLHARENRYARRGRRDRQ